MLRSISFFLLGISVAAAMVTFDHSVVIDEMDFQGKSSVQVPGLCKDLCHVYASVPYFASYVGDDILIQTGKGFVTATTVANMLDKETGRKQPLEIKNQATLTITNGNANYGSGVVMLYIVNQNADYFKNAEVYEAEHLHRNASFARAITVISAEQFTLKQHNYMSMGVIAKLAGFDTLDSPICPAVYSLEWLPFPGFQMTINGPIVSLLYDVKQFPYPVGQLEASLTYATAHQMEQNGFIATEGWHGCPGKEAYQSSTYNQSFGFDQTLGSGSWWDVVFNVQTNASADKPVIAINSNGTELGRFHDDDNSQELVRVKDFAVRFSWSAEPGTHYLVRYNSTAKPVY